MEKQVYDVRYNTFIFKWYSFGSPTHVRLMYRSIHKYIFVHLTINKNWLSNSNVHWKMGTEKSQLSHGNAESRGLHQCFWDNNCLNVAVLLPCDVYYIYYILYTCILYCIAKEDDVSFSMKKIIILELPWRCQPCMRIRQCILIALRSLQNWIVVFPGRGNK